MKLCDMPEWVLKFKKKGHTIKHIKSTNEFALYRVSSFYVKGFKYPKTSTEYLGIITEEGIKEKKKLGDYGKHIAFGFPYLLYKYFHREFDRRFNGELKETRERMISAIILKYLYGTFNDELLNMSILPKLSLVDSFIMNNNNIITDARRHRIEVGVKYIDQTLKVKINHVDFSLLSMMLHSISIPIDYDYHKVTISPRLDELLSKYDLRLSWFRK